MNELTFNEKSERDVFKKLSAHTMRSKTLLSPPDLFISIISMKPPQTNSLTSIPLILKDFLNTISLAQFDVRNFKKLFAAARIEINKQSHEIISGILKQCQFAIPYDLEIVQLLAANPFNENNSRYAAGYASLYLFVSWFSEYEKTESEIFPFLLQSFCQYMDIVALKPLLLSAFYYYYSLYINIISLDVVDHIHGIVFSFFTNNSDVPEEMYSLLVRAAKKVVCRFSATLINKTALDLYSFFENYINTRNENIPVEIIEELVDILSTSIHSLNINSITFFSNIIQFLPVSFLEKYFKAFPEDIFAVLTEYKPCFNFHQILKNSNSNTNLQENSSALNEQAIDNNHDIHRNNEIIEDLKLDTNYDISFGFNAEKNTLKKFDFENSVSFPEHKDLISKLPENILEMVNILSGALNKNNEISIIFINSFSQLLFKIERTDFYLEMVLIYLNLISCCNSLNFDIEIAFNALVQSPIFDSKINKFSNSSFFEVISSIRSDIFEFFYRLNYFAEAVEKFANKPVIIMEFLYRTSHIEINSSNKIKMKFCRSLLNAEISYGNIEHANKNIQNARASIFVILSRLLAVPSFANEFFDDDWFLAVCINSFLFEEALRSFILRHIQFELLKIDGKGIKIALSIANALKTASESFPSINALHVFYDIMCMLNEVAISKSQALQVLIVNCETIATSLKTLASKLNSNNEGDDKKNLVFDIFMQILVFFAVTSPANQITESIVSMFESATPIFENWKLPSSMFGKAEQLIAGAVTPSLLPNFIIREPKFTRFFLKLFRNSQNALFLDAIIFIKKLCEFARDNCIACHRGKVDFYFIDVLNELKSDTNDKNQVVINCLSLLSIISSVISSVALVHQLISLFTVIDDNGEKKVSIFQPRFIKTFSSVISRTSHNPSAFFPLISKGVQSTLNFEHANILNPGFVFISWIYLDSPTSAQNRPLLFSLYDQGNQIKINVSLNLTQIVLEITKKSTKSTGISETPLPCGNWSSLCIEFTSENPTSAANIIVNCKFIRVLTFPKNEFSTGPLSITVGGAIFDSAEDVKQPALMASFGFFPVLKEAEIAQICELGPRLTDTPAVAHAIVRTTNQNSRLRMDLINSVIDTLEISKDVQLKQTPNFTDVLLSSCKIDTFIPLFAQNDLNFTNGKPFINCAELALEMFGSILVSSITSQQELYHSDGISVISHLLMESSPANLTYKLYSKLFSLYQNISYTPLQTQIFQKLLFNTSLWIQSSSKNHLLIVRHWSRSLFPAALFSKTTANLRFKDIINTLSLYYYYDEPQHTFVPRHNEFDHSSITKYRKCLCEIAYQMAMVELNDDDLISFISHILNCKDPYQIENLLSLLKHIAMCEASPLNSLKESLKNLTMILYLMNFKNPIILSETIDVMVILIHQKFVTSMTIIEFVDIVNHQLSLEDSSENLLQRVTAIMMNRGVFELLSTCLWLAATIDEKRIILYIESIQPSPAFCVHNSWCMWPIAICYKVKRTTTKLKILKFLAECDEKYWINIVAMIDYMGHVLSLPSDSMKSQFLSIAISLTQNLTPILDLVTHFVLFRVNPMNAPLNEMINNSPYIETNPFKKISSMQSYSQKIVSSGLRRFGSFGYQNPLGDSNHLNVFQVLKKQKTTNNQKTLNVKIPVTKVFDRQALKPSNIYEKITKYNSRQSEFKFNLRLTITEEWEDVDTVIKCIDLYLKKPDISRINEILVLLAILIRSNSNCCDLSLTINQIIKLEVTDSPLRALVNYESYKVNSELPFPSVTSFFTVSTVPLIEMNQLQINEVIGPILNLPSSLEHFYLNNWTKSLGIFSLIADSIIEVSSRSTEYQLEEIRRKEEYDLKKWEHLWRVLSFDRAPWNTNNNCLIHWKKDFCSHPGDCLIKMKRNWKFDNYQSSRFDEADLNKSSDSIFDLKSSNDNLISDSNEQKPNHKSVLFTYKCETISIERQMKANFKVFDSYIEIQSKIKKIVINNDEIHSIYFRKLKNIPSAIEIFLINGKNYFIDFPKQDSLQILAKLSHLSMPNLVSLQTIDPIAYLSSLNITEKWVHRDITNFEYLMHLNMISSHSFKNLFQYHVFPNVLCDFTSEELNLNDPQVYRDYSNCTIDTCCIQSQKVINTLVRIEPFTTLHVFTYNGKFAPETDQFTSIEKYLRYENLIIPEFYSSSSFLINSENIDFSLNMKHLHRSYDNDTESNLGKNYENKNDDVVLPKWAKSPLDFVYKMRKALESDYFSEQLDEFINIVWGEKQNDPNLKLFNEPHPKRFKALTLFTFCQAHTIPTDSASLLVAYITSAPGKKIIVTAVTNDSKLYYYTISPKTVKRSRKRTSYSEITNQFKDYFELSVQSKALKKGTFPKYDQRPLIHLIKPSTFVISCVGKAEMTVLALTSLTTNYQKIETPLNEATAIHGSENYVAIACRNAIVNVYKVTKVQKTAIKQTVFSQLDQIASIPSYRSKLPCVHISERHQLIVNGTNDGFIILSSLTKCTISKVINLNKCKPKLLLVTQSFGFIVVYATFIEAGVEKRYLFVFTVNGELVTKRPIRMAISLMYSFSSCSSGTDYLIFSDSTGQLYSCEVYEMSISSCFFRCHGNVCGLSYNHENGSVVAVSADGKIFIIPKDFP
ncbi:hypothetical protein TRFO_04746 [Tritrichomonas foetus]|uniref:BEACH domain-containing protein n=1 Tax=Tritrichomonas foetus TaxID=1144522 RepID=A0A1J4KGB0_9EUKA|nr:hypothetical protein TRFO_04746 [Tritrichomonas foetus]|eukprot:OHT08686.1 hypothetical protein TRFO_04746 [Tritrichomonas foetus]